MAQPGILYLDSAAVRAAMPDVATRIELAERTMLALVEDADLPPKIGVDARPPGSFGHAMPAWLRGPAEDGSADLLGVKWVVGFPANGEHGLPAIHATVILSDPLTGIPIAILDGAPITADRTAAISGVAIRHWGPPTRAGGTAVGSRAPRVAILGAGVQARSHLPVIGHLLPGAQLVIHDRHPDRAEAVAELARKTPGIAGAQTASTAEAATGGADVVITAIAFGPIRQTLRLAHLGPDALVIAVDYATSVHHEVALDAGLFLVDERGQFEANRSAGLFDAYPDPQAIIGLALRQGLTRPAQGRVLVSHLGVGLADLVFGDAIVRAATIAGIGVRLAR
jgi:ornithine cyclodeaminase/alanine dehydrogenase-like protein (mu-crystallin family)